ncbi:MAG: 2'-5' RNA ligase family protein [Gemmatimonadaceae bacterium]|jgi:2'-5' RNA ligase|nr:2'-5' RNA ligase family protein [Gemmatimonadaceae bacterium]
MAVDGIFITTELEGELAARVHAHQLAFDPKMANFLPPHVTIIGSSGSGPVSPDTSLVELKARILPVAAGTPPFTLAFGPPERFVMREIVSLRLDPHGPLRELHEKLRNSGLRFLPAKYPFTPHCTLSLWPTLTPEKVKAMLRIREPEPFRVHTLCVYHTKDPQKPKLLFKAKLGERPA